MAAEALAHLGRARRHRRLGGAIRQAPRRRACAGGRPLSEAEWPDALGHEARYPEWLALFEREVADRPPAAVVGEWAPRLLPGTVGAATHGLIRTAHAVRGLGAADTPPRRLEVASASGVLGLELPGAARPAVAHRARRRRPGPGRPAVSPRGRAAPRAHQRPGGRSRRDRRRVRTGRGLARLDRGRGRAARPARRRAAPPRTCATRTTGGAIGLLHSVTSPLACELVPALAGRRGSGRRRGLRLAGRGGLARRLRHGPHDARCPSGRRPAATSSSTAPWTRATSTPSSCARRRCAPSSAAPNPPCCWPPPTPASLLKR